MKRTKRDKMGNGVISKESQREQAHLSTPTDLDLNPRSKPSVPTTKDNLSTRIDNLAAHEAASDQTAHETETSSDLDGVELNGIDIKNSTGSGTVRNRKIYTTNDPLNENKVSGTNDPVTGSKIDTRRDAQDLTETYNNTPHLQSLLQRAIKDHNTPPSNPEPNRR